MIRIGLRDARSHFGRFIMSIVAIALGVSFVVGSFCFREMLNNQVSQMMSTNADHDVYVRGSQEKKKDSSAMSMGSTKSYNDVGVDLAGTIAKVDGVSSARVVHMLSGVVLLDKHGDAVTTMGSPTLAIGMGKSSPWRSAKFTTGTWPKNGDEIALHSFAAEQSGLKVGDKTKIVYPDGAHKVTVSGIFTTDASQAGAIIIAIDPATAKEQANKQSDDPDKTALISVYGNKTTPLDDNAQQQLADRINKALPRSAKAHAITGDEYRDESTKSTQDALGFIQPLILIFAVIALFVGSFIIANTFSMIVRESMRGYALLRSIGASPLQVFSTVIVQALLLGLVGSLAGIGLGWGMVKLIASGLANMGMPLTGATNPTVSDMLVGLVVGIVVTLIGAALPARNAALAPPIQAMNETVNPEKPVLARGILGTVMVLLGFLSWGFTYALAAADGDGGPTPWKALNSIAVGWGMVKLIASGLANMGMPLTGATNPTVSDMLVGLVVGIVVTLIGAALPARNAALAPPIQAMNETVNPEKPVLARGILGTVMVLLGFLSWGFTYALAAADGDGGPTPWKALNSIAVGWPLGIGAALAVIGVIVAGPAYVSTAGAVLGWLPSKAFTVTGRLAQRNISRSKRRTSNTAAALFVGVAIVSCLGVVATSAKASVNSLVDTGLKADFAVSSASAGQIPDQAIKDIKKVDGVNHVVSNRVVLGVKYDGKAINGFTFATQPELFTKIFAAETTEGDAAAALKDGKLLVGKTIADDRGWHVGQKVKATAENIVVDKEATAKAQADYQAKVQAHVQELQSQAQQLAASGDLTGAQAKASEIEQYTNDAKNVDPKTLVKTKKVTTGKTLTIGAIVSNSVYRDFAIVNDDLAEQIGNKQTMFVIQAFVTDKRGADTAQVKKALKKTIKKYYTIVVFDRDEYKSTMSSMIDQMLMVLYALLALSIIIAIFGIVNTLALSVSERTKEIGLLRAIGTSRGQVRGMLGIEAAIISVFGTVLGLVVGIAAGVVIRAVYASEGLETLAIPWLQLLVFLLLSIVVGLVSSISPASRALKQPVLDAVASE